MTAITMTAQATQQQASPARVIDDPDRPLLDRAVAMDRKALDQLIRRYQRQIYRLAFSYVRDHDAAADLTQNTFVRVIRQIGNFRGSGKFKTWLYRIAANLSKNWLRDNARWKNADVESSDLGYHPAGANGLVEQQERLLLRETMAHLAPKQRTTVELRVYSDLSFKEVAEVMGCTVGTAKVNFHHAVKNLRRLVEEREEGSPSPAKGGQAKPPDTPQCGGSSE